VDDEENELMCEQTEMGAPISTSIPKQADDADQLRAPTADRQRKGLEAESVELLSKRTKDERGPPKTTALHALAALTGSTSDCTHRQVTFRRQSDGFESSTVDSDEATERGRRLKSPKVLRRQRPASSEFQKPADKVLVPCDLVLQALASESKTRAVSDTAVAPKSFTGKSSQDPEAWLEYFERYCYFDG
jgi:hypothetical protein